MIAGINLLGNIILLIPVGFLIPLVYKKITWKKMLLVAIAAGFAIEGMQVVLSVGIFDIDDVILNGLGVMTGYWIFLTLARWVELRQYKLIVITTMLVLTVAVASVYFIYPKGQQPFNEREDVGPILYGQVDSGSIKTSARGDQDPCNGTGGTGQIMTAGNNTITIKRRDGVNQKITLTDHTAIRTAAGVASQSDLKIGDRVTVIVDDSETASTILICNATILQSAK